MKNLLLISLLFCTIIGTSQTKGFYWNLAGGAIASCFAEGMGAGQIGYSLGKHTFYTSAESTEIRILWGKPKMISNYTYANLHYQYNHKLTNNQYLFGSIGAGINYFERFVKYEYKLNRNNGVIPYLAIGYKYRFSKKLFFTTRLGAQPTPVRRKEASNPNVNPNDELIMPLTFFIGIGK